MGLKKFGKKHIGLLLSYSAWTKVVRKTDCGKLPNYEGFLYNY